MPRILYLPAGDTVPATALADDSSDATWRVNGGIQSFANSIPNPASWQADELPASIIDNADWNNGQVGLLESIATSNRLAAPAWGFPQDEPPSALKDDDYEGNGIALALSPTWVAFRPFNPAAAARDESIYASGANPPTPPSGARAIFDRRRRRG